MELTQEFLARLENERKNTYKHMPLTEDIKNEAREISYIGEKIKLSGRNNHFGVVVEIDKINGLILVEHKKGKKEIMRLW